MNLRDRVNCLLAKKNCGKKSATVRLLKLFSSSVEREKILWCNQIDDLALRFLTKTNLIEAKLRKWTQNCAKKWS